MNNAIVLCVYVLWEYGFSFSSSKKLIKNKVKMSIMFIFDMCKIQDVDR